MTSRDFVYWLQGFFEISEAEQLTQNQVKLIKKHLAMVFIHEIDPSMGNKEHQGKLNEIHNGSLENLDSNIPPWKSQKHGMTHSHSSIVEIARC